MIKVKCNDGKYNFMNIHNEMSILTKATIKKRSANSFIKLFTRCCDMKVTNNN